jgi:hypothetical protein
MLRKTIFVFLLLAPLAACSRTGQSTRQTSSTPVAAVSPTPSPTKEKPIADRNVSDYAFGGHRGCKTPFSRQSPSCQPSYRTARDFIWNHWREKKRAYIVVRITSPDSASDVHIFVEPDDSNVWRIVWRWENLYCVSCHPDIPGEIYQSPEMRSIKQIRAGETDVDMPLGTRYLIFRDASGSEVERL